MLETIGTVIFGRPESKYKNWYISTLCCPLDTAFEISHPHTMPHQHQYFITQYFLYYLCSCEGVKMLSGAHIERHVRHNAMRHAWAAGCSRSSSVKATRDHFLLTCTLKGVEECMCFARTINSKKFGGRWVFVHPFFCIYTYIYVCVCGTKGSFGAFRGEKWEAAACRLVPEMRNIICGLHQESQFAWGEVEVELSITREMNTDSFCPTGAEQSSSMAVRGDTYHNSNKQKWRGQRLGQRFRKTGCRWPTWRPLTERVLFTSTLVSR